MLAPGNKGKPLEEGQHTGEKTLKELDQEFKKRKDKLSLVDDIKVVVAVLLILLLAGTIVASDLSPAMGK